MIKLVPEPLASFSICKYHEVGNLCIVDLLNSLFFAAKKLGNPEKKQKLRKYSLSKQLT